MDIYEVGGSDLETVKLKLELEVDDVDAVAICLLMQVVQAGRQKREHKHLLPQLRAALVRSPSVMRGIKSSLTNSMIDRHDWD